jgi:hypothetical protein
MDGRTKQAQGAFVQPGELPELEAFYAKIDALGPRFWARPIDQGEAADVDELYGLLSLEDPRDGK